MDRAASWAAAGLVVGATLTVDPGGFAPFGPLRWTVVTAGSLVVVALARAWRGPLDLTTVLWGALLAWLLVATVGAVDPLHAWIGTPDRRLGLLAWVVSALVFLAGRRLAAVPGATRTVVRGMTVAAVGVGAWALAELGGTAPVDVSFDGGRLGGPWGQPAYLGAAGTLLVPAAVGLAADRGEVTAWRAGAAVGAVAALAAVLGSGTRAAWFGLLVGGTVVAPRAWPWLSRHRVPAAAGVVALVVVAALTPIGGRAVGALSPGGIDDSGRLDEWRIGVRALADHPVVGVGPEGYRVVFGDAVDADYEAEHGRDVLPDRAHDALLDVGIVGGVPALVLYGTLLAVVVAAAVRRIGRPDPVLACLGVGAVAFVAQSLLLFPTAELDPIFWLVAGLVVGGAPGGRPRRYEPALAGAVVLLALVALVAGGLDVAADRNLATATDRLAEGDEGAALAAADRATGLRPDSIRTWFVAGRVAEEAGTILAVDAALDRIEAGLERSPRDPALRTDRSRLLLDRAVRSGLAADAVVAVDALDELVADDPVRALHRERLDLARTLLADADGVNR